MSGKLDQSLDDIMKDTKPVGGARRGRNPRIRAPRHAATKAKAAIAAPTGGVRKNVKSTAPKSTMQTLTGNLTGDSKIIVSNLPEDVTETQIKDYFGKTIGYTKRVFLTYGPTGKSRGVATIIFSDPKAAAKAAAQLDGVKVDNRAMRIEVVLGAKQAPQLPAPKSLADRVAKPKSAANDKPKPAAGTKAANAGAATNGAAKGKGPRNAKKAKGGRPKKKTAEELDAEMMDYFGAPGEGAAAAPAPAVAAVDGNAEMVDDVL